MDEQLPCDELVRYQICKAMGWDFYTFESQPPFFIDQLVIFLNQEALREKNQNAELKAKAEAAAHPQEGISRYG